MSDQAVKQVGEAAQTLDKMLVQVLKMFVSFLFFPVDMEAADTTDTMGAEILEHCMQLSCFSMQNMSESMP